MAAVHHGAKAPAWVTTILAAEKWGMAPWQVRGQSGTPVTRLAWLVRWQFLEEQRAAKR